MEYHKQSDTFWGSFVTTNAQGVATAPTGTPTTTTYKNGVAVGALTAVNCTAITSTVFEYSAAMTTGNGFANGDRVMIVGTGVVAGVTYTNVLAMFEVGSVLEAVSMSDLSAMPSATASALAALTALHMENRNGHRQTSDTHTTYKDDGTTAAWTRAVVANTSATTIAEAS